MSEEFDRQVIMAFFQSRKNDSEFLAMTVFVRCFTIHFILHLDPLHATMNEQAERFNIATGI